MPSAKTSPVAIATSGSRAEDCLHTWHEVRGRNEVVVEKDQNIRIEDRFPENPVALAGQASGADYELHVETIIESGCIVDVGHADDDPLWAVLQVSKVVDRLQQCCGAACRSDAHGNSQLRVYAPPGHDCAERNRRRLNWSALPFSARGGVMTAFSAVLC